MRKISKSFPIDVSYVVPSESISVVKVSIDEVILTLIIALILVMLWCLSVCKTGEQPYSMLAIRYPLLVHHIFVPLWALQLIP